MGGTIRSIKDEGKAALKQSLESMPTSKIRRMRRYDDNVEQGDLSEQWEDDSSNINLKESSQHPLSRRGSKSDPPGAIFPLSTNKKTSTRKKKQNPSTTESECSDEPNVLEKKEKE